MNKGLGRGLSSLIPSNAQKGSAQDARQRPVSIGDMQSAQHGFRELSIDQIEPNPHQPRKSFDERSLQELADSIAQYGVLEPIVVSPLVNGRFQIVAGERRFRASQLAGKSLIPAVIRSTSEIERLVIGLIENIQRQDLNPIEKAQSLAQLVNSFGLTQEQVAQKMGMARSTVANSIRLLELPTEIQSGLMQGKITEGHAKILLGVEESAAQMELYRQMTSGRAMSVKELSETAGKKKTRRLGGATSSVLSRELRAIEQQLQTRFGTKVTIEEGKRGHRRISIDVFSTDEFNALLRRLLG